MQQHHAASIFAAGHERKLGYDVDRYQHAQAKHARPRHMQPVQGLVPTRVDLRDQCSPVADQYDLGSCTAFAVGKGLREYLQAKRGEKAVPLSALYLYYETRKLRGTVDIDSGATITDAMTALAKAGVAPAAAWPYEIMKFDQKPAASAYKAAKAYRVNTGVQLAGLEDVKSALARGQAVVFGMRVYNTFRDIGADGKMEMPQNGDIYVGGHAVCAVGYDNRKHVLIVKNSFGTGWGDEGYFYMPYDYVKPELVMDMWTAN
jgi:C1A family cysteine protease